MGVGCRTSLNEATEQSGDGDGRDGDGARMDRRGERTSGEVQERATSKLRIPKAAAREGEDTGEDEDEDEEEDAEEWGEEGNEERREKGEEEQKNRKGKRNNVQVVLRPLPCTVVADSAEPRVARKSTHVPPPGLGSGGGDGAALVPSAAGAGYRYR